MIIGRIGWPELVLILVILIFIFGAKRLRDVMKGIGESVREFKSASSETPEPEPELVSKTNEREVIIDAATKMGIDTRGKSVEDILKEMTKKVT